MRFYINNSARSEGLPHTIPQVPSANLKRHRSQQEDRGQGLTRSLFTMGLAGIQASRCCLWVQPAVGYVKGDWLCLSRCYRSEWYIQ